MWHAIKWILRHPLYTPTTSSRIYAHTAVPRFLLTRISCSCSYTSGYLHHIWYRNRTLLLISVSLLLHFFRLDGPGIESRWGEISRTRPDRPWGQPSLKYNGHQVSFSGVKRQGRGDDHPPPSSAAVRLQQYTACTGTCYQNTAC